MQLTVLGCAGTFPGPASPCSGYLVEHDGYRLVLDLGAGALGNLQRHVDLLDVDGIYITHLHADHCIDLVAYFYARRYHPDGMPPRLPVYGPPGTANRIGAAFEEPPVDGFEDVYDFREPGPGTYQMGPFTITSTVVRHPIECHGLRIEAGGKVLTYSGDTAACSELGPDAAPGHPPHRPGGGRARRAGGREAAAAHAPDAVPRPAGDARRGQGDLRRPHRPGVAGRRLQRLRTCDARLVRVWSGAGRLACPA